MHIYSRERASGKTKLLIEWVLHDPDNRVVLVADSMQRDHLAKRMWSCWHKHAAGPNPDPRRDRREYWMDRVAIPANLKLKLQGRPRTQVAIDNLEEVLAVTFGLIEIVTTSEPVLEYYEADGQDQPIGRISGNRPSTA